MGSSTRNAACKVALVRFDLGENQFEVIAQRYAQFPSFEDQRSLLNDSSVAKDELL